MTKMTMTEAVEMLRGLIPDEDAVQIDDGAQMWDASTLVDEVREHDDGELHDLAVSDEGVVRVRPDGYLESTHLYRVRPIPRRGEEMRKIIFTQSVLDECVREMRRGPLQGVATLVLHPATGRAAVVVEASSGWDYMDPEDGIKLLAVSDTSGHGGYPRGILDGGLLDLPGHPDILQIWVTDYDRVMVAARAILAGRPEEEREEIDTLNEIEDILLQDEIDALVAECAGCWYTIDDASGELVELLFEDLRGMGYEPEIEEGEGDE